jgi:hypothetical protein
VAGKDVEDELSSVENTAGQGSLKVAQLGGREVVVEKNEIGIAGGGNAGDLLNFAGADEGGGVGAGTPLHYLCGYARTGTGNQLAKLGKGFLGVEAGLFPEGFRRCRLPLLVFVKDRLAADVGGPNW